MDIRLIVPSALMLTAVSALLVAGTPADGKPNGKPVIVEKSLEGYHVRHVSYADLDLATPAGQATLTHRVKGAIRYVCSESLYVPVPGVYQNCQAKAWSGAKTQMDRAFLRSTNQVAIAIVSK